MLLAIDTSTSRASIALVRRSDVPSAADAAMSGVPREDATLLAELTWDVGQRHSAELLPRLRWLFSATSTTPADLSLIAVALGPGSFNGVRVALATAKSLAFALGVPIVGVSTLDVAAWGAHLAQGPLWAILDAGRAQVYAASYPGAETPPGAWAPRLGPEILTAEELAERATNERVPRGKPTVRALTLAGEWRATTRQALTEAFAARGITARFAHDLGGRRASWLAQLALARAALGQYDDAMGIEPLYLRRPAITQPAPRQRSRRGVGRRGPATEREVEREVERETERPHGNREAPEATDGEESSRALRS